MRTLTRAPLRPVRLPAVEDRRVQHADGADRPSRRPAWWCTSRPCTRTPSRRRSGRSVRLYRRLSYPRTAKVADAVILNSESLRGEVTHYLDVDPAKLHLIPEAVDHDLFTAGRPGRGVAPRHAHATASRKPFVLFVSSLWRYKNCAGLMRAFAAAKADLGDRQLVVVGPGPRRRVRRRAARAGRRAGHRRRRRLGRRGAAGGDGALLPLRRRVRVPVLQRDVRPADPGGDGLRLPGGDVEHQRHAGDRRRRGAAGRPGGSRVAIADAIVKACGPEDERLRAAGPERAGEFTWAARAERTLDVYRRGPCTATGRKGDIDEDSW